MGVVLGSPRKGQAVSGRYEDGGGGHAAARGAFPQAGRPWLTECLIVKSCKEKVTSGLKPGMGAFNTKDSFLGMFYMEFCVNI